MKVLCRELVLLGALQEVFCIPGINTLLFQGKQVELPASKGRSDVSDAGQLTLPVGLIYNYIQRLKIRCGMNLIERRRFVVRRFDQAERDTIQDPPYSRSIFTAGQDGCSDLASGRCYSV